MSWFSRAFQISPSHRIDAAVAAERELEAPLPVIRRISFAAMSGGVGCSTATLRLAATIASRRPGGVLLVDSVAAELRAGSALRSRRGVEAVPFPVWPEGVQAWRSQCEVRHRAFELTLTDWGVLSIPELHDVAMHSHVVCVATSAERGAVQRALDVATHLEASGTSAIVIASAVRGRATVATRRMIAAMPAESYLLPYDQRAREKRGIAVSDASSLALTQAGAGIVRASARTRNAVNAR